MIVFTYFAVLFILSNTNPWLLLFIVVGVYYLVQKFWSSSQSTSSDVYSTFSKNRFFKHKGNSFGLMHISIQAQKRSLQGKRLLN